MNNKSTLPFPYYMKFFGFPIVLIGIVLIFVYALSGTPLSNFFSYDTETEIYAIYAMILLGTVLIAFSKEKKSDEYTDYIRLKSFAFSIIIHAAFFFVFSFTNLTLFLINFPAIILIDSILVFYIVSYYIIKNKS